MRPLSLELSGFRSYETGTVISFEGRRLVAIVGPTGAGKSSLLDGISYALYGKTPRLKREVKRLICSRAEVAHVRLRFTVDERVYEVTRALPRSGSGEHVLLDESSGQRAIGADEVTRRVTELVGLDFEAFCSSVLLAQGQFARFLEAATTQRTLILKGVFRLDQIDELRKAAKLKTNEVGLELATIEGELRAVPDDAEEQLVDARRRAQRAEERAGELERALPEEDQLEEAIEAASQELRAVGERRRTLADALVQIPAAGDLDGLAQQEAEVDTRLHRAETMLTDCEADLGRRVTELERVEQEFGTEAELVEARARARARGEAVAELERLAADEAERARALTELESAAATAHELAATAAATLEARKEDRRAAEQAHRAHALRKDLEPGQPCPVCEQEVTVIPRGRGPSALAKAERAEREAEATVAQTRSAAATVVAELSAARVTLQHVREGIDRATARIAGLDEELGALGVTEDPVDEIVRRLAALTDVRRRITECSQARDAALRAQEDCRKAAARFAARRHEVVATLIRVAGMLQLDPPSFDDGAAALTVRAASVRARLSSELEDLAEAAIKAQASREDSQESLAALRRRLDLEPETHLATAISEARAEAKVCEAQAGALADKLERARELRTQRSALSARRELFERLAEDLTDKNFTNFLLEERRRLLSELGSARLRALTGRYRFDDDGNFDVVDELDGDKLRAVETLSGGETFLASLALALALAEAVARHGGRLQCFFLDEGFGTLDVESLDLALDGIERIVGDDRLIALVSHVPALSARIEDRIELEKSPEGMSEVRSGASLG